MVALISDTSMKDHGRSQRMVIVDPHRMRPNRLIAACRDRIGQSVLPIILISAHARVVKRKLGVIRQRVVELDGWNVLNLAIRRPPLIVVDKTPVDGAWDQILDFESNGI